MADDLTSEEFAKWMRPKQALELVARAHDGHAPSAASAILTRLKGGAIQSFAQGTAADRSLTPVRVAPGHWATLQMLQASFPFWRSGDMEFEVGGYDSSYTVAFFGIRFRPDDIYDWLGVSPPVAASVAPQREPAASRTPVQASDSLSPEEYEAWLKPRDALAIAEEFCGSHEDAVATDLKNRVLRGEIKAAIQQASPVDASPGVTADRTIRVLTPEHWATHTTDFWGATVVLTIGVNGGPAVIAQCIGLRFCASDVREQFPVKAQPEATPAPPDEVSDPKLPDVSTADLAKWAALFAEVYPGATQAVAVESARGFFQGKNVSRNRVVAAMVHKRKPGQRS